MSRLEAGLQMLAWFTIDVTFAVCGAVIYFLMLQNGILLLRLEELERQLTSEGLLPPGWNGTQHKGSAISSKKWR